MEELDLKQTGEDSYSLDVQGYSCPYPAILARRGLEEISPGELLELITDNKPSCQRVPASLEEEHHKVIGVEEAGEAVWKIRVEKGSAELQESGG